MRGWEGGEIFSSWRKRTSGQEWRERKARRELGGCCGEGVEVVVGSGRMGLKYEVMGAAEAGMKGWRPLMFQDMMRIALFGDSGAGGWVEVDLGWVTSEALAWRRWRLRGGGLRLVSRFILLGCRLPDSCPGSICH